ncbi:hypothetical protein G9C98_001947 [Cotesia typhae]|uniref:Uncharacterized protein n=1 Tax=Cotesia typhae TaxID=2053667 RepID=A0A8J5RIY8_9HYME|nr:hypothetical protein G9C98_001947 [Cotesia typhae]
MTIRIHTSTHGLPEQELSFHYIEKGEITRMLLDAGANVFAMINNDPLTLIANRAAYRACPPVLNVVLIKQLTIQKDFSSPLTYATKNVDYKKDFNLSYGNLRKEIVKPQIYVIIQQCIKYIIKRQGIGYEVAKSDISRMKLLIKKPNQRALKVFYQETKAYVSRLVNRLKVKFIAETPLSYFDIFKKDIPSLAGYALKPEILKELALDNYRNDLRYYFTAFKCKWAQAFRRRKLLDASVASMHQIVALTTLPYVVMLRVFEYIDNDDLKNFLLAAVF